MSKRQTAQNRNAQNRATRILREQEAAARRRTRNIWISVIAVLLLVVAGVIGWTVYDSGREEQFASPAGVVDEGGTKAGLAVAGEGPVPVEVYLDFLCPHCRDFETASQATLDQLAAAGKIRLIWHTLGYLDRASSPSGYSTRAASAAGCASDAGKLEAYGAALFANQPAEGSAGLSDDELIDLGGPVGLNAPSFAQCVRAGTYEPWVANVNDQAARRGVNSTPTVYVDGKAVAASPEAITAAVNAA